MTEHHPDPLTRLLVSAQHGDRAALERFVAETQHDVLAMCRYLGDPDNADDLAQEAYERAFASLHRFMATGPARHWLLSITRRTCADAARRRSRRRRGEQKLAGLADEPIDVGAPTTVPPELDELLGQLDDDRRGAFVLTQLIGLRYEEAAELLDVPIGTIRSRVARAREQLLRSVEASESAAADGTTGTIGPIGPIGPEPGRRLRRPHR